MKTKIIATVGPASSSEDILKHLILSGVDVFRLNFSHGDLAFFESIIKKIHKLNKELKTHIAILADIQGPKIRTGIVENNELELITNDIVNITPIETITNKNQIFINYNKLAKEAKKGDRILIDDGKIRLEIMSTDKKEKLTARVAHGGILKSQKGVNLPDTKCSLPSITNKDKENLAFIFSKNIQWIALSFVRSAADIIELKTIINNHKYANKVRIIAKIEKPEAIQEIDEIIDISDGIMIARGDLGVEMPLEQVPLLQKQIVSKCLIKSKPVIIATQMMESMITNVIPTRAEVNDVANSVIDGADALMLSAETSVGDHPVGVIKAMQNIITYTEENRCDIYYKNNKPVDSKNDRYLSDSIILNACNMANQSDASAIIAMTHTGYAAFNIAAQRPKAKIFIFTKNHHLLNILSLVWGVRGVYYDKIINTDQTISDIQQTLKKKNLISKGDIIINIASVPFAELGKTNMLKISRV